MQSITKCSLYVSPAQAAVLGMKTMADKVYVAVIVLRPYGGPLLIQQARVRPVPVSAAGPYNVVLIKAEHVLPLMSFVGKDYPGEPFRLVPGHLPVAVQIAPIPEGTDPAKLNDIDDAFDDAVDAWALDFAAKVEVAFESFKAKAVESIAKADDGKDATDDGEATEGGDTTDTDDWS